MSDVQQEEQQPNPYNMRKPWHTKQAKRNVDTANALYFADDNDAEEVQATRKAAPKQKASEESVDEVNYKKRYDDLKKHYDERIAEFKQKEQEMRAEIEAAQPTYQPPKSREELEAFKRKHPDLYDTVETVAHVRTQEEIARLQEKLAAIEAREAELTQREAFDALRERHPDFETIKESEDFHDWASTQPEDIQRWIYNNPDNVSLASRAIDLYKLERGKGSKTQTKSKPVAKPSAADMVSTKTTSVDTKQPKIWTKKEIASLSMDEYDRLEAEIDAAIMEGRVRG